MAKAGSVVVCVALLRGVNVGGKHTLPMDGLRGLLEGLGCVGVKTYIQSGNAVFALPAGAVDGLPKILQTAIQKKFDFDAPVVLRPAARIAAALTANPFLAKGADPAHLHVGFLAAKPAPSAVQSLDPKRSPGDSFAVSGSEVYLHLPNGVARTKLTNAYFDSALKTVCTLRNWRSVQALDALARGIDG